MNLRSVEGGDVSERLQAVEHACPTSGCATVKRPSSNTRLDKTRKHKAKRANERQHAIIQDNPCEPQVMLKCDEGCTIGKC